MQIEVVYALAQAQERVFVSIPAGGTVQDALDASGLLLRMPECDAYRVGIWGKTVTPQARLEEQDRVEIYRPLLADPKEIRRTRAAKQRA